MEAGKIGLPMVLMARLKAGCGTWPLVSWAAPDPVSDPPSRVAHTTDSQDALYSIWHIFGNYCKSDLMENCGFFPL